VQLELTRRKRRRTWVVLAVVVVIVLLILAVVALFAWVREPEGPSIVGVWRDTWRVETTGNDSFTGIGLSDAIEPDSGCPYRAGETEWRITGRSPRYDGEERWVKGSRGQNCEYAWSEATFTLLDGGKTLEVCSADPWNRTERLCRKLPRTGG
jgi:hypothetical protein